jgi:hypothetical protein
MDSQASFDENRANEDPFQFTSFAFNFDLSLYTKVVSYPLSLLAASVRAMEITLGGIRDEGYPAEVYPPNTPILPTFTVREW